MAKASAGIAMYRRAGDSIEVFLVHFGAPFWARKDVGAWSFPKGEYDAGEDTLATARREFREETGFEVNGDFVPLGAIKQRSGKVVTLWAVEGNCDADVIQSNTFSMEWPPKSGRRAEFPEVDRAGWFTPDEAKRKLVPGQAGFVDRLCEQLGCGSS